jgi:hypothetical protein
VATHYTVGPQIDPNDPNGEDFTVDPGGSMELSAAATDQFGNPMTLSNLTWSIASGGIGSISTLGDGSARFTAPGSNDYTSLVEIDAKIGGNLVGYRELAVPGQILGYQVTQVDDFPGNFVDNFVDNISYNCTSDNGNWLPAKSAEEAFHNGLISGSVSYDLLDSDGNYVCHVTLTFPDNLYPNTTRDGDYTEWEFRPVEAPVQKGP